MFVVVLLSLVATGCGSTSGDDIDRHVVVPDPSSTLEVGFLGGGTASQTSQTEIAASSDSATTVKVIDVHRSIPNTPDGAFPAIDTETGPDQLRALNPITLVDVEIVESLGGIPLGEPGEIVTITVIGGTIATLLTPEEAKALDIDPRVQAEVFPHPAPGQETVTTQEPVADPHGLVPMTIGVAPSDYLTEGDTVTIFTVGDTFVLFGSGGEIPIIRITHPAGIFSLDGDSVFDQTMAGIDVRALAASIRK